MPVSVPARYPPKMPKNPEKMAKTGHVNTAANNFGTTKYEAELMPITSRASICSVILMVPNSPAMFDPTLPANTTHINVDESSNKVMSLTILLTI